jgi:hypothetical protein
MTTSVLVLVVLLFLAIVSTSAESSSTFFRRGLPSGGRFFPILECCLQELIVSGPVVDSKEYQCETHPEDEVDFARGRTYDIDIPAHILNNFGYEISRGNVCISIPNAVVYNDVTQVRIEVPDPTLVKVIEVPEYHRQRRMTVQTVGVSTLLVVIVKNIQGNTQTLNSTYASNVVFDADTTFATVYRDCSAGALTWEAASGYSDIVGGRWRSHY